MRRIDCQVLQRLALTKLSYKFDCACNVIRVGYFQL